MIRFCDKDVYCVNYDMLDRDTLVSYFLNVSRSNLVCVMDDTGKYLGMITYASLLSHNDVFSAIMHDAVILNEKLWEKGRDYFKSRDSINISNGDIVYLPVVDADGSLLYFLYQDDEANKEIRMLWELLEGIQEDRHYLDFFSLYPEFDCVTVHGCNELAWYFVQYLNSIGMPVNVEGELWKQFGEWDQHEIVDYKNYHVYAEGTWPKEKNMLHYILRSASVEFECVDRIYEENIKAGLIKDAEGDSETLFQRLRQEKEIVILGIDANAQDTYDLLYGQGIDIYCFYSLDAWEQKFFLLGKPVMGIHQITSTLEHPVFVECVTKYSAWGGGIGNIDRLAYIGYPRNKQVFFLQDYMEIPRNQLRNILKSKELVLAGSRLLCQRLRHFFEVQEVGKSISYIGELDCACEHIQTDVICLIAEPIYYLLDKDGFYNKWRDAIDRFAERTNMLCYTGYFSMDDSYLEMERDRSRYLCSQLRPKGIIIGSIKTKSGNYLLRDILNGHPNILLMKYGFLNENLFFICLMLAEIKAAEILSEFWNLYRSVVQNDDVEKSQFPEPEIFSEEMKKMLAERDFFTSQELFVMFHLAYSAMYGMKMDIKDTTIYFEPHFVDRNVCSRYALWLNDENVQGSTISIVRNACIKAGSMLKGRFYEKKSGWDCMWNSGGLVKCNMKYDNWNYFVIKFEDLKINPRETIEAICNKTGLPWSNTLLILPDKEISPLYAVGFDLKPVYNNYEEYFSEYDRMRVSMFNYHWQKEYGYPYIGCIHFSAKEMQEMFLKEYRFEDRYNFGCQETYILYRLEIKRRSNESLREVRRLEMLGNDQ